MLQDLERRFEEKAYQEASMYYRLKDGLYPGDFYRACIINFQNFAKDYPESKYNEELAYKLVEVSSGYAENSIFNKKEERLNDAIKFASNFYRRYPESKFTAQVKNIETETRQELESHLKRKKELAERAAEAEKANATAEVAQINKIDN